MQSIIKNLIKKRIFWYCDGAVHGISETGFQEAKPASSVVEKLRYSIQIVSRKHYKETFKEYPIVDRTDLNGIINNEFPANAIRFIYESTEHSTLVKVWVPDATVSEFLTESQSFWIPETLVLESCVEDRVLTSYGLAQYQLFLYKLGARVYSTLSRGTFAAPNNFLLSIGADINTGTTSKSQDNLAADLVSGIFQIRKPLFLPIIKAQKWGQYIKRVFHWPSVLVGAFAAFALYVGLNIGYLHWQQESLRERIETQQLHLFIKKEKQLEQQIALLNQVQANKSGASGTADLWELVAYLLGNEISVLRIQREGTELTVRLEAESATESLEFIQSLPFIAKAQLSSSVARSRGKQRFNLEIQFKQGKSGE